MPHGPKKIIFLSFCIGTVVYIDLEADLIRSVCRTISGRGLLI